jgi:hypothetical protein
MYDKISLRNRGVIMFKDKIVVKESEKELKKPF